MKKIVLILLIAIVASLQVKADNYASEILEDLPMNAGVTTTLSCDVVATDTIWRIKLFGNGFPENAMLLIKTTDNKVLTLELAETHTIETHEGWGTNPLTGEPVEYKGCEDVYTYQITTTALDYISQHGITKVRVGVDGKWFDCSWKRNEWGKSLSKAYRLLKEKMSPDYVPPKKPSIYDGF